MGWIEAEEEEQEARRRRETVSTSRSTLAVPYAMAAARAEAGTRETRGQATPAIAAAAIGEEKRLSWTNVETQEGRIPRARCTLQVVIRLSHENLAQPPIPSSL